MSTYERLPLEGVGLDVAFAWFLVICAFVAVLGLLLWLLDKAGQMIASEEAPEPEPERIDPRDLCSDLTCRERATTSIQGFGLCGQHAYERTGRGA